MPPLNWFSDGFANGDTAAVLIGVLLLSTNDTSNSPVGDYPIDVKIGSLEADNYTFRLVAGMMTVHSKVLDILVHYGSKSMSLLEFAHDLPFVNISSIEIQFSDDVIASKSSFLLQSDTPSNRRYIMKEFQYDRTSRSAIWSLPKALDVDRLFASLDEALGARDDPTIKLIGAISWGFAALPGDFQ